MWRCATKESGEQCVMTSGILMTQVLPADSLVSVQNVSSLLNITKIQQLVLLIVLTSELLFSACMVKCWPVDQNVPGKQ